MIKKKILFMLKDMNIGGVEKSFLSLLNEIPKEFYEVDVLFLEKKGGFLNDLPDWVTTFELEEYSKLKEVANNPPLSVIKNKILKKEKILALKLFYGYFMSKISGNYIFYYNQIFSNIKTFHKTYDCAISYSSIMNFKTYYIVKKVIAKKKVGWIHFDVDQIFSKNKLFETLHKDIDKIFIVSKNAKKSFDAKFPLLENKTEVFYNITSSKLIAELSEKKIDFNMGKVFKIVTLGRLSKEKGQDMIPEIIKLLIKDGYLFKWILVGEGNLQKEIEEKVKEFGIEENLYLAGVQKNPYPCLKNADIYVQTSHHEGYCIALAEAKALNKPIITTNFVGAKDQIINKETGLIVNDTPEEIYLAIKDLISNVSLRKKLSKNLEFSEKKIEGEINRLFKIID